MGTFFSALQSIANYIINGLTSLLMIKFAVLTGVGVLVSELTNAAIDMLNLDDGSAAETALSGLGADVLYFLGVFRLDVGIPLILAAVVARFTIRRLPIIG